MTITIDAELLALITIGLMAGTLAAMIFERRYHSTDMLLLRNLIIGIVGALLGSFIFDTFNLRDDIPALLSGTITLADILVAFVGAALLMMIARLIRR